jgi:hypothetical protein
MVHCLAKGLYKLVKDGKELKKSYNGVRLKKYAKPSMVNDAAGSRSKYTINPDVWLPGLGLTAKDKKTIQNNLKLDDKVINAAQTVLKQQFPGISGWQDTILSQTSFESIPVDSVQIHHNPKRDHWVCSSSVHGNIQVFDSLFETLSASMQIQLAECYRSAINFDVLEIEVPSVQRQSGGIDCGLFAIAFAYELASGNEHTIQSKRFEQHRMRDQMPREWRV